MSTITHPAYRRRFLVGTGFVPNAKTPVPADVFFHYWIENTLKVEPYKIFVVCAGGSTPPMSRYANFGEGVIIHQCDGDLGHIRDKHEGRISYPFTGWAGAMMLAALAAYNECLDFIYKEQDCLAFGEWAEQLYADMGDGDAALGRGLKPPHHQLQSSQSLFIVRHRAIPDFVARYIRMGDDQAMGPCTGENKFKRMIQMWSNYRVQSGWNVDRDRPLPTSAKVWAAQQITPQEFKNLI